MVPIDVAIMKAEDCVYNIRGDFRNMVMRLIEYVRSMTELMWERLRTHEDFTTALIHLAIREQNDAHQQNWREKYEKELKRRVMAKRANKRLSCVPTPWEMAIPKLGADSESRRSYAEKVRAKYEAKAGRQIADNQVPTLALAQGAGQTTPVGNAIGGFCYIHQDKGTSQEDRKKVERDFIDFCKSLMVHTYTDKTVAGIFNGMRLALDKDPTLTDCYPMGIDVGMVCESELLTCSGVSPPQRS